MQTTDFRESCRDTMQLHRVVARPSIQPTGHRTDDS